MGGKVSDSSASGTADLLTQLSSTCRENEAGQVGKDFLIKMVNIYTELLDIYL
jgi:hypothetical protein